MLAATKPTIIQQQTSTILTMKNFLSILSFVFLLLQNAHSQEGVIRLINPSFEGIPQEGSVNGDMIDGWHDCGFLGESTPDVHPKENSTYGVTTKAADGDTYLGMVVRDNDTWERVSQQLSSPLMAGHTYEFSILLARSMVYKSPSRKKSKPINFVTPSQLRIWGGNSFCDRRELLAESGPVINSRWLKSIFKLKPMDNCDYIIFEAFYISVDSPAYNGNILLDKASDIIPANE